MKRKYWVLMIAMLCYSLLAGCGKARAEKSIEQSAEQSKEQSAEQSVEQSAEQSAEQGIEQSKEQGKEQSKKQNIEQGIEQNIEQSEEPSIGQHTEPDRVQYVEQSIVRISVGSLLGSGVIYKLDEDYVWIVTAGHVLEQADGRAEITFPSGNCVSSLSYQKQEQFDFACIKVDRVLLAAAGEDICTVAVDRKAFDKIARGDKVYAAGYKKGIDYTAEIGTLQDSWVYVEAFGQSMMVANLTITDGMSGGGLFDEKGTFLGILCGVSTDGETVVVPYSVIDGMWE